MVKLSSIFILFFVMAISGQCFADAIILHKKNATIWLPQQSITGEVTGFTTGSVTIHHNQKQFEVKVIGNKFSFTIQAQKDNRVWATVAGKNISSDTV
ncbi:MAG: hypothetical protein EOP47_30005, partial [Sphingobacteriaceae bacterium]